MDSTKPMLYHAHRTASRNALIFEERTYSYSELNQEINRYSHGFIQQGLKKEKRLAYF